MKCSIVSRPMWNKTATVLILGTCNVFIDLEGSIGQCVVPVQLKSFKRDGKLGNPFIDVRQPQYQDKKNGKYRVSYLTIHLNGEGAKEIERLVPASWLKQEVKRLFKSDAAGDYELVDEKWVHTGDRAFTSVENSEDEGWMAEAVSLAGELAEKAQERATANAANAEGTAENAQKVSEILS